MAKLDMRSYPELMAMMSRRERDVNYVRSQRAIDPGRGDAILEFWTELVQRIELEDDLDNMTLILREINGDIDMLRALQQTLSLQANEPEHAAQIAHLVRMIRMLLEMCEQFKRRHWFLRDRALAYFLSVNPAMPSRAEKKKDTEKDAKKSGQAQAKRAVDEAKAPAKKKDKPTKKMSP